MTAPPATRRTRTVQECADEIGVSAKHVRAWISNNELPAGWFGNHYLVLHDDFEQFLKDKFAQHGS